MKSNYMIYNDERFRAFLTLEQESLLDKIKKQGGQVTFKFKTFTLQFDYTKKL
jgi:hypothetical protein